MDLDPIRKKVWDGEALSQEELEALEAAAQQEGGPVLRTMVAQALINADAAQQALPILEAVTRDYPRDVEAHLALGRALMVLERWADAERPLKRALAANPGDPEAHKALAVLALRRGEWDRARAMVDEVLRVDPFDGEAQQLSTTLDRAGPGEVEGPRTEREFALALTAALEARATPHLVEGKHLLLRLEKGGVARLPVEELYATYLASQRPLEEAAGAIARELAERQTGLPTTRLGFLAQVLPVLRPTEFIDRAQGAVHREGPAGLFIYYVFEDPQLMRYVPEGLLPAYRVTPEQLDAAAFRNLARDAVSVRPVALEDASLRFVDHPTGLWAVARGDGHDGARLLVPRFAELMERAAGAEPLRVYLGLRELVVFCPESDAAAVRQLHGLDAAKDGVPGAFRLVGGRLTALEEWMK